MNMIVINIHRQILNLLDENNHLIATYTISSAKNGCGELKNSFQTPRGKHVIQEKMGDDMPIYTLFKARKATGEIYSESLNQRFPNRDWILTRILRLAGLEKNFNQMGHVDTFERFIYIHGTHDEKNIGLPNSHGCIRMKNQDIIVLFDCVKVGDYVYIQEDESVKKKKE